MTSTVTLRLDPATETDFDTMVQIQKTSADHLGDPISFVRSDLVSMLSWTRVGSRGLFVVRDEGQVVGHLRVVRFLDADPVHMVAVVTVDPEFRDAGVARWTYQQVVELARNEGATALDTVVDSRDRHAGEFLDHLGFEPLVTIKTMEAEPDFAPGQPPQVPLGFTVRAYRKGKDAPLLTDLFVRTFSRHQPMYPATVEETLSLENSPSFNPELTVFLEDDKGEAIGYARCTIRAEVRDTWIDVLGVVPEFRGRGLGRFMLLRCMYVLAQHRPRAIRLSVDGGNERALDLYESEGFRTIRTRWRLRKALTGH